MITSVEIFANGEKYPTVEKPKNNLMILQPKSVPSGATEDKDPWL
jgi:hypothetical protein